MGGFLQGNVNGGDKIFAGFFPLCPPPSPEGEIQKFVENPTKVPEDVLRPGKALIAAALQTFLTELVINASFVRVAQHFIGFSGVAEAGRCLFVFRVAIRVVFQGQFPIGPFDLFG